MYIRKYSKFKDFIQLGEHQMALPDPPPLYEIQNYKLSPRNQKFYHTEIPKDLMSWSKSQQLEFVEGEYKKRKNGIWVYINEQPIYIPPNYYYFLNYWLTEQGYRPSFKDGQRKICLFVDHTFRDEKSMGCFIIKPRGIGWTDLADSIVLERATRIRNSWHSLYHMSWDDNFDSFKRMIQAYSNMAFYFKPMTSGSDLYKSGRMRFEKPAERITKKTNQKAFDIFQDEEEEQVQYLNSEIIVQATVQGKGDSKRHKTVYFDEFGKMASKNATKIDLQAHHDILKFTLFIENGKKQIGKMLYGSTVEDDTEDGLMVDQVRAMWDNSDSNNRQPNGFTVSGLYRLLVPATWGCETDEFGFHKEDEFLKQHSEQTQFFLANGKIKELISYRRKQCLTIEDALSFPSKTPLFDQEKLERQLWDVQNYTDDFGNVVIHKGVRARLIWKDGIRFGRVEWIADENGEWEIFRDEPNSNAFMVQGGIKIPANRYYYGMGIDPYETKKEKVHSGLSKGTCVVFRKFDATIDNDELPKREMKTHQIAATYSFRHKDPMRFCEDMLMTAIYFGTDALIEKGRGNLITKYFTDNQCQAYLQYAHRAFGSKTDARESGVTPNENTIGDYVMMMMDYVYHYSEIIYSESLLKQLLNFENERKSRTKSDLAVAFGWALLAVHKNYGTPAANITNEQWITMYQI